MYFAAGMRNPMVFCRRLTLWVIAAQLLNLSLCGDVYQDASSYRSSLDPTESFVEWFAEMHFGQLEVFDYHHNMETHKGPAKSMHWHVAKLYYSITAEHYPSFFPGAPRDRFVFYSRIAGRSLDRPPRLA